MKNKILLGIIAVLSIICGVVTKVKKSHSFFEEEKKITIKDEQNQIQELNMNDYLIGVIAAEMPALFEEEALKAQAVAARSYALYKMAHTDNDYDVITSVVNQDYITPKEMQAKWTSDYDTFYQKIKKAVLDTDNEVMLYNNEVIEAFYFSMSNGQTESAEYVFQENLPYLQSVTSTWEEDATNFIVTKSISKNDFCTQLELKDCRNFHFDNPTKSSSGRILTIKINSQDFTGVEVREKLQLRSTDFSLQEEPESILVTTKGYGHGVGMSQYGANGMAKEGYTYKDILNYYYKDITIQKMV